MSTFRVLQFNMQFGQVWHDAYPDRADRVINLLRSMHGGADYVAEFGHRQRGAGPYADQIALRFKLARQRLGLNAERLFLRTDLFRRPVLRGQQLGLF